MTLLLVVLAFAAGFAVGVLWIWNIWTQVLAEIEAELSGSDR